jgi:hypothetical protein
MCVRIKPRTEETVRFRYNLSHLEKLVPVLRVSRVSATAVIILYAPKQLRSW